MTKLEKINSLNEYLAKLNNRLSSPPNKKHENHPESLKAYLNLEVKKTLKRIEKLKLEVTK